MRATVSVDCLSNSSKLRAACAGHLDVKSCPSSCLSANQSCSSWSSVITESAVFQRFQEEGSCQFPLHHVSVWSSVELFHPNPTASLDSQQDWKDGSFEWKIVLIKTCWGSAFTIEIRFLFMSSKYK